jgi:hypothetical protein
MITAVEVLRLKSGSTQLAVWSAVAVRQGIPQGLTMIELLEDEDLDALWWHFYVLFPSCEAIISALPSGSKVWWACDRTRLRAEALTHFTQA